MPKVSTSWKPGHSGNPSGRPPGSKNKRPANIKAIYEEFMEAYNGRELMVKSVERAFKDTKKLALQRDHMDLAAKVLDRADDAQTPVTIVFGGNLNPDAMKQIKGGGK